MFDYSDLEVGDDINYGNVVYRKLKNKSPKFAWRCELVDWQHATIDPDHKAADSGEPYDIYPLDAIFKPTGGR